MFSDEVNRLGEGLLADVEEDFGTIDGIARRLELWRKYDLTSYTEAYASLCLPKLIGPLVRFNLLTWNPILVFFVSVISFCINSIICTIKIFIYFRGIQ